MRKLSNRTFGVELEIVGLYEHEAREALEAAGLNVTDDGYVIEETWVEPETDENGEEIESGYYNEEETACAAWCVKDDGSLSGINGECEVVSPILRGEAGLAEVARACRALERAGATVNATCGMHVHLGAEDLSVAEIVGIFKRYAKHEESIDRVLHKSRRGLRHEYAASIKGLADRLDPNGPRANLFNGLHRYLKVNLQALRAHGTIEFRHHNGAIKAETVTNWIRFLLTFVERSRTLTKHSERPKPLRDDHPWIGLDIDTRRFYRARENMDRHAARVNHVATWG